MFGIEGDPTPEQTETIADAKHLIFEGMEQAVKRGAEGSAHRRAGRRAVRLRHPRSGRTRDGLKLAMPVEKSGQNEFDFQYGAEFGAHIEKFDPDFSKVLVRYNPDDPDVEMNERQLGRLKELADWLHAHDRKFLFELLVPATDEQLASVDGDTDRYDAELRPELMRRAIEGCQQAGIEVDIWKIEGVDERDDAVMLAEQARSGEGREGVTCVLLGRGASTEKVEQWLQAASTVDGLHRLRDRPLDLVGRAEGVPRRRARPRSRGLADRRQLPAFHRRIRAPEGRLGARVAAGRTMHCVPAACTRSCAVGRLDAVAMKMRQSLAQIEQEFRHETQLDLRRQETLRRHAVRRSRLRTHERERKRGSMRYWVLVLSLIATAVIVTVAMFETLYLLLS